MARGKDRKVWNEDLARACENRYEMDVRNGMREQFIWKEGAQQIKAIRGDIIAYSTGRVVNLPTNKLKKTVLNLCMDIIQGRKTVVPEGYAEVTQGPAPQGNPFEQTHISSRSRRGEALTPS